MVENLKEIAFRHGTDKKHTRHNFVAVYADLFGVFRYDKFKFFEIGVYIGRSHNMWVEYFPNAHIYGIDVVEKTQRYEKPRLQIDMVDQSDEQQLFQYADEYGPWRVIIDDGSHMTSHQILSFNVLWDYVDPGGYYIIEDTHSSYWEHLIDSNPTLMKYMLDLTHEMCHAPHYKGYYSNVEVRKRTETLTKYQEEIEYITYRMGMIIIKKRNHD